MHRRERERESVCVSVCVCVCVCVCVLFEFLLWELVYVFQSFVPIFAKKNLIVRDVQRFQFLSTISDPKLLGPRYNINWNSKSAERAKAFWFSDGRTK